MVQLNHKRVGGGVSEDRWVIVDGGGGGVSKSAWGMEVGHPPGPPRAGPRLSDLLFHSFSPTPLSGEVGSPETFILPHLSLER